jgi:hypothetical protein
MDIKAFARKATKELGWWVLKVFRDEPLLHGARASSNDDARHLLSRSLIEQENDRGFLSI